MFWFNVLVFIWLTPILSTVYSQNNFQQAPFIRYEPQDMTVLQGEEIRLRCVTYGYPPPVVTWFQNNQKVVVDKWTNILKDHTLIVSSAQRTDSGLYYCVAVNTIGNYQSRNATVVVKFLGHDYIRAPQNASINLWSSHTFTCIPPDGYPRPQVTWQKDGSQVLTSSHISVTQVLNETQLTINAASHDDAGEYSCVAKNNFERRSVAYLKFNPQKPDSSIRPDQLNLYAGKDIQLNCVVFALPTATVTWSRVGDTLPEASRVQTTDGRLIIRNAQIKDSGSYQCLAKNNLGEDTSTAMVNVYEPAKFAVQPTDQRIGLQQSVSFDCAVTGGKNLIVAWFLKQSQKFIYDKSLLRNRIHVNQQNQLVITNVEKNDEGTLYCQVSDDLDVRDDTFKIRSATVTLTVLRTYDSPPSLSISHTTYNGYEDDSLTLYCSGGINQVDTYEWDKASTKEIIRKDTAGVVIKTDLYGSNLTISNLILMDAGMYRCKGTGPTGTATKVTKVSVLPSGQGVPKKIQKLSAQVLSPTSIRVRWSKPVTHSAAPILSYVVTIMDLQQGTENKVSVLNPEATEKIVSSLKTGAVYKFSVYAKNKNGDGLPALTQPVETGTVVPSLPPGGTDKLENVVLDLSADTVEIYSVTVQWNPVDPSRIKNYILFYRKENEGGFLKKYVDKSTSRYLLPGLQPNTNYQIYIQAVNDKHVSTPSQTITVQTANLRPEPVPYLSVISIKATSVKLIWGKVTTTNAQLQLIDYVIAIYNLDKKGSESMIIHNELSRTEKVITQLLPQTNYKFSIQARTTKGQVSTMIPSRPIKTKQVDIPPPIKVGMRKIDNNHLEVYWKPPENFAAYQDVKGFKVCDLKDGGVKVGDVKDVNVKVQVTCLDYKTGKVFIEPVAAKSGTRTTVSGLDTWTTYKVYVSVLTNTGRGEPSKFEIITLGRMRVDEVRGVSLVPTMPPSEEKGGESGILKIVKEPWFIATVGIFIWLCLLVLIVFFCCRHRRRKRRREKFESRRGLLTSGQGDYPNTSLNRRNGSYVYNTPYADGHRRKKGFCQCCNGDTSSVDEDFPNRADIKPLMTYTKHGGGDSIEMRGKASGDGKENNIGLAMKNGMMVDTPLNNELDYRQSDQKLYESNERPPRYRLPPGASPLMAPHSGSMGRREPRYQTDSVERRQAEIIRTAAPKSFPDSELVNVLENNPQATWKQEGKNSPRTGTKPPGENTLRRQGKTQFKPLPKLEVLNWAAPPVNNDGSEPGGSPKLSSSASMFSENTDMRADSRMSHGGSSNSLNKDYRRRRRNSNASSMMSSELYQSEMDPSGYSDIGLSERKSKRKEKIPPPIDLDGVTSDILLQWAESVTNSSPSSSGSSSPDRLSGISSEGSIYTDEDFAQAVAAVVECQGFNMDYDYSLPGMPGAQQPLSASRNTKMNKIDQVLAQRSKLRQSPASTQVGKNPTTPISNLPQISMSGYLTGSHKGPQSTHSAPSGIPRSSNRYKSSTPIDSHHPARYGTGFQDVDSVSTASSNKPLTMSNLLRHDSSLEREKTRDGTKPLTISNLRQHETSLDRHRVRQQPAAPMDRAYHTPRKDNPIEQLPEPPLSSMSALERHESMHSNSKDSVNSSNRHDSEVENNTSERKDRQNKRGINLRDPKSSTSTISTVRTSPDHGDDTDC